MKHLAGNWKYNDEYDTLIGLKGKGKGKEKERQWYLWKIR